MTPLGHLEFNNNSLALEETNIYGIFEHHGNMTWHIEIFPEGEDNYIMFNSLLLEGIISPKQLSAFKYQSKINKSDLYEHTIRVNGHDRFLQSVDMVFGNWDTKNQTIQLSGEGTIDRDDVLPTVSYKFNADLRFTGLNIFETTKEATQEFVDTYLKECKEDLEIKFEKIQSGLQAVVGGRF